MTRLHELDLNIGAVEWGPFRFYRWRLEIAGRVGYGRTWTYRGAVKEALRACEILRQLSVVDAALAGADAA